MVSRFGRVELLTLVRYLDISDPRSPIHKAVRYIRAEIGNFWWDEEIRRAMTYNAGFFPATDKSLARFAERILTDLPSIDILGSWQPEEERLREWLRRIPRVPLADLEPYKHERPWSGMLQGKRVLVIHPFASTIRSQYQKRALLYPGRPVLPEFDLVVMPAVQTIAGSSGGYRSWFEALDAMCEEVARMEFDVAIIGAGAYGMPLAAHVKRLGRKAIHLGGATQLLFGIRGRRWDDRPDYHHLFNDAWVRPGPDEIPLNHRVVEEGAYW